MTDPSATAVGLGFVAFALLVLAIRFLQVRLAPSARPAAVSPQATAGRCHHYFRKAFADMWRCAECGQLQPVTADEVLDAAAEDFRDEFDHVEAYANGEVTS